MTMKELARLAGVSPAAVSRYLNGGSLSQEKQDVIRAAIEKTGYRPDVAAQTLRTRTTDLVGLIVPKLDSESVSRVAAGAAEVLAREGYLCQIAVSQNDPERELSLLNLFRNRSMAGVILMGTICDAAHEDLLRSFPVPVVVTGQKYRQISCIYHDDFGAAQDLTRLVLKRGRKKPVFIGATEQDAAAGLARRQGVQAALQEAGLDPELPRELSGFDIAEGRAAMERLLEACPALDAVICATDRMAFGAMEALRNAGRRIPEDVSIVGIGDSWACRHIVPNLTTAHFYYRTCGESAARLLLDRIQRRNASAPVQQVMLSYTIQERASV